MNLFEESRWQESAAPYERLARKALAAYGIEEPRLDLVSCERQVLYRVSDPETRTSYALRLYPSGWDRGQILRTLFWLAALRREARLLVPEPVLTRTGELVQSLSTPGVSGFRQTAMLSWVSGQRLPEWTATQACDVGRLIGKMHEQTKMFELPGELALKLREPDALDERIDPVRLSRTVAPEEEALLIDAADRVRRATSTLGTAADVAGLIHANLTPEHVVFEDDAACAIGFTGCRWGYYAYDLATMGRSLRDRENGDELRSRLLEGYEEVRPLPPGFANHRSAFAALRVLDELRTVATSIALEPADAEDRRARRLIDALREIVDAPAPSTEE
ncbi:MAG: phosphotransferase [Candidatus Bipolaricaulia bacterium]